MPPRKPHSSAESDEVALLRDEVTELKNQVHVLSDILNEIREELQWVTRNGLPIRELLPTVPVLKRMARDPCAEDWADRLVIDRGTSMHKNEPNELPAQVTDLNDSSASIAKPPAGKLFAEAGDQGRLF